MKRLTLIIILYLFIIGINSSFGQNPYATNMSNNQFYPSYVPNSLYGTTRLGDAAVIVAQGSYALSNSEAAMNYETAYSMNQNNKLLRTQTYFENRQLNMYYRDLEEWQKEERRALKRSGLYNREAIEYIYGYRR
jgi:hypothetical protein